MEGFLEELVVRRELADNYCFYVPDYDSLSAAYDWARQTLDAHRGDKREFLYTRWVGGVWWWRVGGGDLHAVGWTCTAATSGPGTRTQCGWGWLGWWVSNGVHMQ